MLALGASVIGLDLSKDISTAFGGPAWLGVEGDVTDPASIEATIAAGVDRFGGVDMTVAAAGIFGANAPIAKLDLDEWSRTLRINLDGVTLLLKALHPFLALAPRGGRVVLVGSKNVPAPGKGAAAYSASKAAMTQLGRVAALEWASEINGKSPTAQRMLKFAFNMVDDGLMGQQVFAGEATRLAYGTEEAAEGRDAFVEKRPQDFGRFPWQY